MRGFNMAGLDSLNFLGGNVSLVQHAGSQDIHSGCQQSMGVVRIPDSAGRSEPAVRSELPDSVQEAKIRPFHGTNPVQAHDDDTGRPGDGPRPDSGPAAQTLSIKIERQDRTIVMSQPIADKFSPEDWAKIAWEGLFRLWGRSSIHPELNSRILAA